MLNFSNSGGTTSLDRRSTTPHVSKIILFETVPNKLVGFVGEGGVFRIIKLAGDGVLGGDSPS